MTWEALPKARTVVANLNKSLVMAPILLDSRIRLILTGRKMKKALIIAGGWEGHEPELVSALFAAELRNHGMAVDVAKDCSVLTAGDLAAYALIVPCWTMGTLSKEQSAALLTAVRNGVGLGGFHGGMGDAFRGDLDYEWMVGGHFVGHPHVGAYTVRLTAAQHPITAGLPLQFSYDSEQYYMMVDPGIKVLADTVYCFDGRRAVMPVVWTHRWGAGRVFYSALGHKAAEFTTYPHVKEMTVRGLLWAAGIDLPSAIS